MEQGRAGRVPGPVEEWGLAEQDKGAGARGPERDRAPGGERDVVKAADKAAQDVADRGAAQAWVAAVDQESKKKGAWIMPCGDRTGPMGMGPMSGRAAGFCAGYGAPGYMNAGGGRGFGMGFGRGRGAWGRGSGRGWRNMFYATGMPGWMRPGAPYAQPQYTPEQELTELKQQAEYFGNALEEIKKQIQELEARPAKK